MHTMTHSLDSITRLLVAWFVAEGQYVVRYPGDEYSVSTKACRTPYFWFGGTRTTKEVRDYLLNLLSQRVVPKLLLSQVESLFVERDKAASFVATVPRLDDYPHVKKAWARLFVDFIASATPIDTEWQRVSSRVHVADANGARP